MKKFISILLAFMFVFSICAVSASADNSTPKLGLICLHDENSTYDLNFISAFKAACEATGCDYEIKTNVPESSEAYEAACNLADDGCNIVFADSFGHEDYLVQAAEEYPDVQFSHATGTQAHTAGLDNFHNAFASIYEGRYLDGIAAGMKLNEMISSGTITADQAIVGYVGAYTYAEVISGYTSFFLGVRSICPTAIMKVTFTGSWYDETAEKEAANRLITSGCVLISGHADSMGAPTACQSAGVPFVFYNGSVQDAAPDTFIISTKIDWQPYFEYMINCYETGEPIAVDWVGTLDTGSVVMTEINDSVAAEGTAEALDSAIAALKDGSIKVFDCTTFTVGGENLTSYMADVDTDENYTPDTEVIQDGIFLESTYRSAPYFDLQIDGIELLDTSF